MDGPDVARAFDRDYIFVNQRARRLIVDYRVWEDDFTAVPGRRSVSMSLNHSLQICMLHSLTLESPDFPVATVGYAKESLKIPSCMLQW